MLPNDNPPGPVTAFVAYALPDDGLPSQVIDALERRGIRTVTDPDQVLEANYLVYVASPAATMAQSVVEALETWVDAGRIDTVAILLTEGTIDWDPATSSFTHSTNALPDVLAEHLNEQPLLLDVRDTSPQRVTTAVTRLANSIAPSSTETTGEIPVIPKSAPQPTAAAPPVPGATEPTPTAPPPPGAPASPPTAATPPAAPAARRLTNVFLWVSVAVALLILLTAVLVVNSGDSLPIEPDTGIDATTILIWLLIAVVLIGGFVLIRMWLRLRKMETRLRATSPAPTPFGESTPPIAPTPPTRVPTKNNQVFLSHNTDTDATTASRLATDLDPHVSVWISSRNIAPGDTWVFEIEDGLRNSSTFVVLLSPEALDSGWVRREINAAMTLEVDTGSPTIVPWRLGDSEVPLLLRGYQMIDTPDYQQGLNQLLNTVKRRA